MYYVNSYQGVVRMAKKRVFTFEELSIIKDKWEGNMTIEEISSLVSTSPKTLQKTIKENNWIKNYQNEEWLAEMHHVAKLTYESMAALAHCSVDSIADWMKKHNLDYDHEARFQKQTKYSFNRSYFKDIDTEEKAYWLGMLIADGTINSNYVRLALKHDDKTHLQKMIDALGANINIKDFETRLRETGKAYQMSMIQFNSTELAANLICHKVLPNKSTKEVFPDGVPAELEKHVIRGIFDGDGCFSYGVRNRAKRDIFGHMSIVGSYELLHYITQVIKKEFDYDMTIHEKGKIFCIRINGTKALAIMNWLYSDATIWLDRKRQKVEEYANL